MHLPVFLSCDGEWIGHKVLRAIFLTAGTSASVVLRLITALIDSCLLYYPTASFNIWVSTRASLLGENRPVGVAKTGPVRSIINIVWARSRCFRPSVSTCIYPDLALARSASNEILDGKNFWIDRNYRWLTHHSFYLAVLRQDLGPSRPTHDSSLTISYLKQTPTRMTTYMIMIKHTRKFLVLHRLQLTVS